MYPEILITATGPGGSYCTSSKPCSEGFGDCDYDYDCKTGLTCGQRDSYADNLVGLIGYTSAIADYCYDPSAATIT